MIRSPPDFGAEKSPNGTLTESEYHRLLAAEPRRRVVEVLANREEGLDVESLARAITETDPDPHAGPTAVERATICLYHFHLPMMADLGMIEFDPATMWVSTLDAERLPTVE